MDNFKAEIYSAIFLSIIVLIKALRTYLASYIIEPIKKLFKRESLDLESLTSGRTINNLLVELRVKMDADRATIFLFHNGQHFNPKIMNNAIWKFTSAYESCKEGVSYESHNLQNLLMTNHIPLIESFLGKMDDGYTRYECKNCPIECDKSQNIIVIINVEAMNYGNTKNLLELQGTKKFITSPIIIDGDYVGFVCISYLNNFNFGTHVMNNDENGCGLKNLCIYANKIGYNLSK